MKTPCSLLAAVILASTALTVAAPRAQAGSGPAPTLFGQGPEIYISPTWGTTLRRVTVVGLGYQPGRTVVLSMMDYDPWAGHGGGPDFEDMARARTVVGADGRLRVSFVIPITYAQLLLHGRSMDTLDIRAHYGRGPVAEATPPVGSHAVFMLMSRTYAPTSAGWGN